MKWICSPPRAPPGGGGGGPRGGRGGGGNRFSPPRLGGVPAARAARGGGEGGKTFFSAPLGYGPFRTRRDIPEIELSHSLASRDIDEPPPIGGERGVAILFGLRAQSHRSARAHATLVDPVDPASLVSGEDEARPLGEERELGIEGLVVHAEREKRRFDARRFLSHRAHPYRRSLESLGVDDEDGLRRSFPALEAQVAAVRRKARVPLVALRSRGDVHRSEMGLDDHEPSRGRLTAFGLGGIRGTRGTR